MKRSEAIKHRKAIESSAVLQSDEMALEEKWMYPSWGAGVQYGVGDRIRYGDGLYKCVQSHTSQSDWTPDVTSALWVEVSVEEYPEWRQPTGAHDAYNKGDKCSYKGEHYVCIADGNVYAPDVWGWEKQ